MKNYLPLLACTLPLLLLLAACTDAGKCKRGELDCQCTTDNTCATGALCKNGTCVASSKPPPDEEEDSGPPKPIDCTVTTFKGACKELCRAVCKTEEELCIDSHCGKDDCTDEGIEDDAQGLLKTCVSECGDDVACLQGLCTDELKRECEDFWYPDPEATGSGPTARLSGCFDSDPKCVLDPDYGCSDTCGTIGDDGVGADLVGNGICEDGGENSIKPPNCSRSSDCSDCGSRVCGKQGAPCTNSGDCCGFFNETAYCVDIDRDPMVTDARCLVTCTTTQDCDDGYACIGIKTNAASVCSP